MSSMEICMGMNGVLFERVLPEEVAFPTGCDQVIGVPVQNQLSCCNDECTVSSQTSNEVGLLLIPCYERIGARNTNRTSGECVAETPSLIHELPCEDRGRTLVAFHNGLHIGFCKDYQQQVSRVIGCPNNSR